MSERRQRNRSRSPAADSDDGNSRDKSRNVKKLRNELLQERFGYSEKSNPFGDSDLAAPFRWQKKEKVDRAKGVERRKEDDLKTTISKIDEIEAVKKRREVREAEIKAQEELRAEKAKAEEEAKFGEAIEKEEAFEKKMTQTRTELRLARGRETIVDSIAQELSASKSDSPTSTRFPPQPAYTKLAPQTDEELKASIKEIESHVYADDANKDFWEGVLIIANDTLALRRTDASLAMGIASEVLQEVEESMSQSTPEQLQAIAADVAIKLASNDPDVDTGYWEAIQERLPVWQAMARCKLVHAVASARAPKEALEANDVRQLRAIARKAAEAAAIRAPSPGLISANNVDLSKLVDPLDDRTEWMNLKKRLVEEQSAKLLRSSKVNPTKLLSEQQFKDFVEYEKSRMGPDDAIFSSEVDVFTTPAKSKLAEKFRPRKPRYFNRVKTGYDWNKYNQTHYDYDNPPPKAVQGYRFNVFYPDLINKNKAPTWRLEKSDTDDTLLLRFAAGPPYEDVAFKISNREWDLNTRSGFKNSFEKGVLQLYFNFKRLRYRR